MSRAWASVLRHWGCAAGLRPFGALHNYWVARGVVRHMNSGNITSSGYLYRLHSQCWDRIDLDSGNNSSVNLVDNCVHDLRHGTLSIRQSLAMHHPHSELEVRVFIYSKECVDPARCEDERRMSARLLSCPLHFFQAATPNYPAPTFGRRRA